MQCLHPITLKNDLKMQARYGTNFRTVPCGKCAACIDRARKEWFVRVKQECKNSINTRFITLTYSDKYLPHNSKGFPCFNKRDVQLFFKRLRKELEPIYRQFGVDFRLRYFLVGEYGSDFGRPHYHAILFNLPPNLDPWRLVYNNWKMGRISCTKCKMSRVGYCVNYMYGKCIQLDSELADENNKLPLLTSRRPGIGANYLTDDIRQWHLADYRNYYCDGDLKYPLPRFYKDKIFNDLDKLHLNAKLNKYMKEQLLKDIADDIEYYQRNPLDPNIPHIREQRKIEFLRKFYARIKKHKSKHNKHEL